MFGLVTALAPLVSAQQDGADLTSISLESLMNTQVTSVSRHEEELRKTAAAVYVITQEDIRRSGATDITDLLRMVPGVQVAQINSSVSAVGARGFNFEYSTKLLVLVDGRTVYNPTFSGVYWHLQNLILEDIERIEVIRGPGATMWGANAVNGVISITTKKPANAQGGLLVADSGSGRPPEGAIRFGGALGNSSFYKLFGRQTTRGDLPTSSGASGGDSWNLTDGGFLVDWSRLRSDSVTVEGSAYRGVTGSRNFAITSISPLTSNAYGLLTNAGGHVLARWNHTFKDASNLTVQAYYNMADVRGTDANVVRTLDLDLQYRFKTRGRNDVMVGFGQRKYTDNYNDSLSFGLTPSTGVTDVTSGFIQDEIALVNKRLYLNMGTKVERNTLAGNNVQPSAQLSWTPTAHHSAWLSASHAVRTVNRVERSMYNIVGSFPAGPLTGLIYIFGQKDTRSEALNAYEAGYRYQAGRKLWLDLTSFYNVYSHLSENSPGATYFVAAPSPHLVLPLYINNSMKGETYGAEAAASYKVNSALTLKGSYSFLRLTLLDPTAEASAAAAEGQSPRQQVSVGSFLRLPKSFDIASNVYFVSSLAAFNTPAYTRVDMNIGWRAFENIEFNVVGQNLLGSHMEFGSVITPANVITRSIFGKVTWKF